MTVLQNFLKDSILCTEIISVAVAFYYYNQLKSTYWKWFIYYLFAILIFEIFGYFGLEYFPNIREFYYGFIVIPFQFYFFYWLYAIKSLKQPKLFWLFGLLYLIIFILSKYFDIERTRIINMLSYSVGVLFLFIFVLLEFFKQIKSDDILDFKINKMFYINLAVALFYVGTLPFFAFYDWFTVSYAKEIWRNYWTVFLFLNCIMYLIFAASFIWGKKH